MARSPLRSRMPSAASIRSASASPRARYADQSSHRRSMFEPNRAAHGTSRSQTAASKWVQVYWRWEL